MPRPKQNRKMLSPPKCRGFKPFGYYAKEKEQIYLHWEEYEAIRLCDYELLSQEQAAKAMEVSRPTLTRIYEAARRKIATAFSECRVIVIEGGNVFFDSSWFRCNNCTAVFTIPEDSLFENCCPLCKSDKLSNQQQKTIPRL